MLLQMGQRKKEILALDFEFYDDRVEHADFASTRTLLEHEIVAWNPAYLLEKYSKGEDYLGSPCLTDSSSAQFARDLARRSREFEEFLDLGRLLVIFIPQPIEFYVATGKKRNDGTKAKPRITRLVESRQVAEMIPRSPKLHAASGSSFEVAGDPSFAAFWRAVGDQFEYRAFLEAEGAQSLLKVRNTDRVVSASLSAGTGLLLFLPHLLVEEPDTEQGDDESEESYWARWEIDNEEIQRKNDGALIDALYEYARETRGSTTERLPAWTERFILPREKECLEAADKAASRAETVLAKVEEAKVKLLTIQSRKKLVTLDGKDLERAVGKALTDLGCVVEEGRPGRADRIVKWGDHTAVAEIKGTIKSASETNATQLEKWVAEYALETGEQPKGILLVNGWRNIPLNERVEDVFPSQMLPYAEGRGHCLVASSQLLAAIAVATKKTEKEKFLRAMFTTVGILDGWAWRDALVAVEEDREVSSG